MVLPESFHPEEEDFSSSAEQTPSTNETAPSMSTVDYLGAQLTVSELHAIIEQENKQVG